MVMPVELPQKRVIAAVKLIKEKTELVHPRSRFCSWKWNSSFEHRKSPETRRRVACKGERETEL